MRVHKYLWSGLLSGTVLFGLPVAGAAQPSVQGSWAGPFCWPNQATHMMHLHTGKILFWPGHFNESGHIDAWLWDPKAGCFGDNPADNFDPQCFTKIDNNETNLFCSGHAALADGRILITGGHTPPFGNNVGKPDANLFNPDTETWTGPNTGVAQMAFRRWYPTCTTLPDGRILTVSGSNRRCDGGAEVGENCISHTDCGNNGTCSNGTCNGGINNGQACDEGADCLVADGAGRCDEIEISDIPEIYDPSDGSWTALTSAPLGMPFYPLMFLLPDGKIFYAGVEDNYGGLHPAVTALANYTLDIPSQTWTFVDFSNVPGGSAVMYEPGRILKAGGFFFPAVSGVQVIDMTAGGSKQWQNVQSMTVGRVRNNLTLLADGTVLVTGGSRVDNLEYDNFCVIDGILTDKECSLPGLPPGNPALNCPGSGGQPSANCPEEDCTGGGGAQRWVARAEIFNPQTGNWETMANMQTPRMYHSSAVLLPDGRVVKAGGGQGGGAIHHHRTFELFSPPYLFQGQRPTVTSAPESIRYSDAFFIDTPNAAQITKVHLIRLACVTHGFDQNQRLVPLAFRTQATRLLITGAQVGGVGMLLSPTIAPPGYYMLFIVNSSGVPSVGKYVQVTQPTVSVWVDFAYVGFENGAFDTPFNTLAEGQIAVPLGGIVRIKAGSSSETLTLSKAMRLESFDGSALVGTVP